MNRHFARLSVLMMMVTVWSQIIAAEPSVSGLKADLEFAKMGDVSLTLDAFVPAGTGPFPTCILVHGGGFVRGDKQSYIEPLFEPLSQAGFTWFTINYRLAPQHRWPACAEDVETAIRWVKTHANEYKVDVSRIALVGESAGGHLVSYVGTRATAATSVAAVVPFYAPHDLELQVRQRNALGESMTALLGLTELNDDAWKRLREVSPSSYVHAGMPPFLLVHGDQDQTVPNEQSVRFQQQLKSLGNQCDLITIPGGVHGMGAWDKLNSDYRQQTVAWLQSQLKPAEKNSLSPQPSKQTASAPKGMALPEYDPEGKLLRPAGFEKWVVVGTSIGLDYSDGNQKSANNPGTFHSVYLQPEAFEHYVATGTFPEQTVFIVTNNKSLPAKTKGTVSRSGFVAAPTSGLEIAIKDSKRYPDGWAYFMFHDKPAGTEPPVRTAERAFARKDCFDCHAEHGEVDNVFTQFYSVLTEAREQRLAKESVPKSSVP